MKKRILRFRMTAVAVMMGLLIGAVGKLYAYDFSAVCETGQILYYTIIDVANCNVKLTCPGNGTSNGCYSGFTKPVGNIILPDNVQFNDVNYTVTSISGYAFYSCSDLTGSLEIPSSVTSIGYAAFYGCSGFSGDLTINNSVTSIGNEAFSRCGFTGNLVIGDSVTTIGADAFSYCSGFKGSLTIPNSVTTIGNDAFNGCSGFSGELVLPNLLTTINQRVFEGCSGFSGNLIIPNSVTRINDGAFSYCRGLNGSLYIPSSVTIIDDYAFFNCSSLTGNLTIPNSVISIGSRAFTSCSSFSGNLTIGNSVTSIGNYAFSKCSNFSGSLTIPNSVTTIGIGAFNDCSGFSGSLTIGNSVISIDYYAFLNCSGLTDIVMLGITPPILGFSVFSNTNYTNNSPIFVPYESLNEYKTATNWSNYENRIFPMAYTTISGYVGGNGNWQFIASPLAENTAPTTIDNMITETTYDLYRFDQTSNAEWQNYKVDSFNLVNGQGYLYANQEDVNLIFKGTFNEGTSQDVSLTYDGTAQFAGWNLVGNPFPYAATVSRSYYVMNEDGTSLEPNPLSAGNTIAACTGIMVKADVVNESVTFAKPSRQNAVNNGLLHIAVANEDKAIVSFNEGDALEKFVFNKDKAQIYIPQGGKDYAIATVGRDAVRHVSTDVPVNFKATENGIYTFRVDAENLELDYLHLIDNLTGADVDLLVEPSYTFEAKTTDYASRFRLVFSVCGDAEGDNNALFAFINNGNIIITADAFDASLQVMDMLGHVLVCRDAPRASAISITGMAKGMYVLRLIEGEKIWTQKIVID